MPIALFLAMMLYQAAPADAPATAAAAADAPADVAAASAASGLPKDDYGLVAWCHGALAGQLELDPIVHTDMIAIEGKAKVAARAQSDAEMEKDRRAYLREYERALAAAEKASPTAIHQYGVESEVAGYKLWGATRQKQPIWRMLDWGMWDPNDAGCNEAAKRLYNKSTLFAEALKSAPSDQTSDQTDDKSAAPKAEDAPGSGDQQPPASPADTKAPMPDTTAPAPATDSPLRGPQR